LKFLPEPAGRDPRLIERLYGEVRLARQVSHPNVCRVYDVGELDGTPFISMEYVDGEDLKSLLRRIGRLPGDKAVEIARRLCAGLAAAHDKGVLHRDLKPGNIMIDGRGQVRIMDFGLARLAEETRGAEMRTGTPAYMAPEQSAGREVSVRSDLYALGLVLFEMFTGKRAFPDDHNRAPIRSLSSTGNEVDPAVERIVLRCLDAEPRNRPASALPVAAALPHGDPLAEALAAGKTPPPDVVAAAEVTLEFEVRGASLCLALSLIGLAGAVLLTSESNRPVLKFFEHPPEVLAQNARDLAARFGYPEPPTDRAYGFSYAEDLYRRLEGNRSWIAFSGVLTGGQPPTTSFWYRQSPRYLDTLNADGVVSPYDPPPIFPGMLELTLDPHGRLLEFRAVPLQQDDSGSVPATDWNPLFAAAGLDPARFMAVRPMWNPRGVFDSRAAWSGSYAQNPSIPLRVEAALWQGHPVYFQVIWPWTSAEPPYLLLPDAARAMPVLWQTSSAGHGIPSIIAICCVLAAATLLAWGNYRRGRSDFRGASRLSRFAFVSSLLAYVLSAHHVPVALAEVGTLLRALGSAFLVAALYWGLYTALEPYLRRRWPETLIAWTRLLSGGLRDPLIGRQMLVGITTGAAMRTLLAGSQIVLAHGGFLVRPTFLAALTGTMPAANLMVSLSRAIPASLGGLFAFFLLRSLLRRSWLAAAMLVSLIVFPTAYLSVWPAVTASFDLVVISLLLWVVAQFGVLAATIALFVEAFLASLPLTSDFSAWYAGSTWFALVILVGMALWSFRITLAGRPLFGEDFLEN
jgi:serine/threonine-protein kinase